jgi:inhibitor of KinA
MVSQTLLRIDDFGEDFIQITFKEKKDNDPYFFWQFSQHILQLRTNLEAVPGEDSLVVQFNPLTQDRAGIKEEILSLLESLDVSTVDKFERSVTVPICYDDEFALDIEQVTTSTGLTKQEIIDEHCQKNYEVKMIGFTPGFVYLGDLSEKIKLPRLSSPRPFVSEGSVGIANNRTGIYPLEGPAGWSIIGRTPMTLFDLTKTDPFLIVPGMRLNFEEITKLDFKAMLRN